MRARIITRLALDGFTRDELQRVRLGAQAILDHGGEMGTLILPGRPELYRLDRTGANTFTLCLTTEEEVAQTVFQEARR